MMSNRRWVALPPTCSGPSNRRSVTDQRARSLDGTRSGTLPVHQHRSEGPELSVSVPEVPNEHDGVAHARSARHARGVLGPRCHPILGTGANFSHCRSRGTVAPLSQSCRAASGSATGIPAVPGDEAVDGGGVALNGDGLGERDGDLVEAHRG